MSRIRLFRTASFRLATLYLALFAVSALALGSFVYLSIRHQIFADFDERIVEEADALRVVFAQDGRERLAAMLEARGANGGGFVYGLAGPSGARLAGELEALPIPAASGKTWIEMPEADGDEPPEARPEIVRALVSRLADGSTLIVGDEQRRPDELLRRVLSAFGWAVAVTLGLGVAGGLWLSAQFLRRIDSMRLTAQGIMGGDWSRRIPLASIDDDLSALGRTFNRLFDRIEKLLLANKQVSSNIAHDLRKPLARVLRRLQAASGSPAPEEAQATIRATIDEVEGVLDTFNALLRIGEVEAGARRAAFRPLNLAEVVAEIVEAFQPSAEEEGKSLVCRLDADLPIRGDRELLTQMFANLLDNALRHTPAGVRIEVAGERTPVGVSVSVSDNGPGVAAKDLKAIFRRFHRADVAGQPPGTGLGLSLVAAIAELHGLECVGSDNRPGLRVTLTTAPAEA